MTHMPGLHNKSLSPTQNSNKNSTLGLFVSDLPVKLVFLSFSVLFVFGCDKLARAGEAQVRVWPLVLGLSPGKLELILCCAKVWAWTPNHCLKYNSCS